MIGIETKWMLPAPTENWEAGSDIYRRIGGGVWAYLGVGAPALSTRQNEEFRAANVLPLHSGLKRHEIDAYDS